MSARPVPPTTEYDHHSPEFVTDNREVHRELRERCPVARSTTYGGFWVLSGYDEVNHAAHDDAVFSSSVSGLIPAVETGRLLPIQTDPPETAKYRRLISPYLTPRALAAELPRIQADIDEAVGAIVSRGEGELVEELCNPIPARATMRLLGLEPDDWAVFGKPLHRATFAVPGSEEHIAGVEAVNGFTAIIEREVDQRYDAARSDLITDLTRAEIDGRRISRQEVIDLVRMLIFGGMDTVMAALSNIFATLAQRPDLRRRLVEDPDLVGRAIEEFLRFEAPIQGFARRVMSDVTVSGQELREGETAWLAWGSANHDAEMFEKPGELHLDRQPNRHLTFGVGEHRCLGSSLARMEMRMAVTTLLAAAPDFEPVGEGIVCPATVGKILGKTAVHVRIGD